MCSNVSTLQACNSLGGFTIFGWILSPYRFCVENNPVKKDIFTEKQTLKAQKNIRILDG